MLLDMWKRGDLKGKSLSQIVGFAGDGYLRDGGECATEFRRYLCHIPLAEIRRHAEECICSKSKFQDSGLALQDIVNEIGRRLGFAVEDGRYQGVRGKINHDGLWSLPNGQKIVAEIKTTDAYTADTDKVAKYRHDLIKQDNLDEKSVSVLWIVGRKDSGVLEVQIRGSRHAWDMRVIGVDALIKIAEVKDRVDEPTFNKIYPVLIPEEFTRLDSIAELMLSVAVDASEEEGGMPEEAEERVKTAKVKDANRFQSSKILQELAAIRAVRELKEKCNADVSLIRRSRTTFSSPDNACKAVCLASKKYKMERGYFWFSIRSGQKKYLDDWDNAWVILCCGDAGIVFLIPWKDFPALDKLPITERADNPYWHVHILKRESGWIIRTLGKYSNMNISRYLLHGPIPNANDILLIGKK